MKDVKKDVGLVVVLIAIMVAALLAYFFMDAVTDDVTWVLTGYYIMAAVFGLGGIMGWVFAKTDVK